MWLLKCSRGKHMGELSSSGSWLWWSLPEFIYRTKFHQAIYSHTQTKIGSRNHGKIWIKLFSELYCVAIDFLAWARCYHCLKCHFRVMLMGHVNTTLASSCELYLRKNAMDPHHLPPMNVVSMHCEHALVKIWKNLKD